MDYEKKVPEWGAPGVEPPDKIKAEGFEAGYKPPADYFNWFWHTVGQCLTEIRTLLKQHAESVGNPHNATAADIGAAEKDHAHSYNDGITATGDGTAYTATVDFIKSLKAGVSFTMIPSVVSTTVAPTLNVNNLGAKNIRRRLSSGTASTAVGGSANWLGANKPIRVEYDGTYWIADIPQANATDIYGVVPIAKGGHGAATAKEARENLGITPANIGAAPAYDYSEEDLTAGESELETGKLYFVYE